MHDEANMSDSALLVSVEDLINMAMGPSDKNVVNYKLMQTVLHILARQMRMLEQRVQIRITDEKQHKKDIPKQRMDDIKEERRSRSLEKPSKEKAAQKEIQRIEKSALKAKEKAERAASKDREKADRAVSKERAKAEKDAAKEKEKAERAESKDREKLERSLLKDRDKAERAASKEREKAERAAEKEREKGEKAAAKEKDKAERASSKEREKAERASSKERERAERASSKEREKEERASSKEREKAESTPSKEREKADKAAEKEREKAEKAAAKDKDKAERASSKEREKAEKEAAQGDKAALKEKEKAEKAAAKEKEKEEKASAKEKEKAVKEKEKVEREKEKADREKEKTKKEKEKVAQEKELPKSKKGRAASDTSILISEVERRKEKVLVVEKGPTTRTDTRRESIEVVTKSQFDIVQAMVKELQERAGPLPPPALPKNKKLMKDLAKGSATLPDTMEAMQVKARVQAAEKAITRMGEMLTALAAAGALPEQFNVGELNFEPVDYEALAAEQQAAAAKSTTTAAAKSTTAAAAKSTTAAAAASKPKMGRKSVAIAPMSKTSEFDVKSSEFDVKSRASIATTGRPSVATATSRASMVARPSVASKISVAAVPGVTHPEMDSAIRGLRDELTKNIQNMTTKAASVAENANTSARAVAEKLDIALQLDIKISTLHSLVCDYADQLSGFDAGLTTQMSSFRDQMNQIKAELGAGLKQLEQVNNNAETAAVLELTERYEALVVELDNTVHTHRALTAFQSQLGDELHSLVECVEMLREEKADRDEVLDGLRDKADNSRLAGLLTVVEFNLARLELEKRLEVCHDKFKRQENVWMTALKDLKLITESKAEITQLLAAREAAELMLQELLDKQIKLAMALGEPKAAMLTRALARDALCGACLAPALMAPRDASHGAPAPLPALRPRPVGADDRPCVPEWKPPEPPDNREHVCHRWCGGSHTLLEAVTRERAAPAPLQATPTKRYAGYGFDGRLYMLEEDLQPCVECNKFLEPPPEDAAPAPPAIGAGDQGPPPETK